MACLAGGGWCETLDDCLTRSKGSLGSSRQDKEEGLDQDSGYFSTDPVRMQPSGQLAAITELMT
eukprot:scaffold49_cov409-Prasinococcus_capsulatus_cf.AAC.19